MWSHFEILDTCAPHSETNCAIYCGTSWVIYFPNHSSSLTVNNNTPKLRSTAQRKQIQTYFWRRKIQNFQHKVMGLGKVSMSCKVLLSSLTANYSVSKNNMLSLYHLQLWQVGKYQQTASCDHHYQYMDASHLTFAQNMKNFSCHEIVLGHVIRP